MLEIIRIGCNNEHTADFSIYREHGYTTYLLLLATTRAVFTVNGEVLHTEPNTIIFYNKNTPHRYGADGCGYSDDWIEFECSENIASSFSSIIDRPIYIGNSIRISDYMHLICDAYYGGRNPRVYSNLIRAMLEDISSMAGSEDKQSVYFPRLVELRQEIYRFPARQWTVKVLADEMALSEPYFQELYKKNFGISCIADVINSRVEAAKNYLSDTQLNISEVASLCGYNSSVHFSRQFHQITGLSPSEYRKK